MDKQVSMYLWRVLHHSQNFSIVIAPYQSPPAQVSLHTAGKVDHYTHISFYGQWQYQYLWLKCAEKVFGANIWTFLPPFAC